MSKIQEVATAVERGKSKKVAGLVQEALDSGATAPEILNAMIDSMTVVGDKFTKNEIFVPEMLVAARAMQKGVEVLKPLLVGDNAVSAGKMIMGTVAGDLHDIGKNLVIMMLESAGFEVIDLGVDVPAEKFIEAIENYNKVEDAYTKQLYDRRIKNFNPSKIACRILMDPNKEKPPVIEWNFNSLKLAIDTMFALNETTERKTVKMCKHCGKPFASDNLKAEYCSPQCRNQANVYKSRAKSNMEGDNKDGLPNGK